MTQKSLVDAASSKYQDKYFNGTQTTSANLSTTDSGFKFAGLTVGKKYMLTGNIFTNRNGASSVRRLIVTSVNNGATLIQTIKEDVTSDFYGSNSTINTLFTAVSTTIEFSMSLTAGQVEGDGTKNITWARLQEAEDMTATTEWT